MPPLLRGADASSLVDWASLKAVHRISFGIARCQRQPGLKDVTFDANMQRMHDADLIAGGYEFALPTKDANGVPLPNLPSSLPDPAVRARNSWSWFSGAAPRPGDKYCLDLEQSPVGQDPTNAWAREWYAEWFRIADRGPGLYLGSGYLTNRTGEGLVDLFDWLWFPRYGTRTSLSEWPVAFTPTILDGTSWADSAWGKICDVWQFVEDKSIDVDGNVFNGTLEEWANLGAAPVVHDPLDKNDVIMIRDADVWPPPASAPDKATNPTWALKSHIGHITEAADYKIPAAFAALSGKIDGLATKADVAALKQQLDAILALLKKPQTLQPPE